jgi:(1->4)-alpha-D-glucan 1-alpha-D-glucosylmutase
MTATYAPPASTYRVQLSFTFTLHDLAAQVHYLAELGVTDIYLSPICAATPGSTHGYDIVDHGAIDPERGGCDGWNKLCGAAREHGMGLVLDVVPNHMAAHPVFNRLWRQVLSDGPSSPASRYFDVDWRPLSGLIHDKVLLPVLEEPYGESLQHKRIRIERNEEECRVRYNALHLPLAPGSLDPGISDQAIEAINAEPERIHEVLEAQHYRLAYWRAANDEINYRRFFDVSELVAIRAEDEEVFEGSHRLVLELAATDIVHGLRIDHVDGLFEPASYLRRLQAAAEQATGRHPWIVVEKILSRTETLDPAWPVDGTTGYDALNVLNRLFVSGRGVRALRHFYQKLTDDPATFRDVAYRSQRRVMHHTLRSGLTLLAHALKRVADASWTTRDITLNALSAALVEFVARLPVYRTYLGERQERPMDREAVEEAFSWAIRRNPTIDLSALSFLRSLLLESPDGDPSWLAARRAVVKRLEQYTSGVQAKGIEDTAYYRDNALLALNEVGGDPGGASETLPEFHRFNEARARRWPNAQTATSTHDTKLSEDTRIRIATLSVFAREWMTRIGGWRRDTATFRQETAKGNSPDINDEYRVYQILVGIWPATDLNGDGPADPALVERMSAYMRKAVREARVHTSWLRVNEEYEAAVDAFVRGVMTEEAAGPFRSSLREMVRLMLPISVCHSMSQVVLKCLMPGVPDVYQGTESWALFVTDPDNRQPVDFARRSETLTRLLSEPATMRRATCADDVLAQDLKTFVTTRLLQFRRSHRTLMATAAYTPLRARGARAATVIAFRRTYRGQHVIVAVPRLIERSVSAAGWPIGAFWVDTELRLPSRVRTWTHLLSNEPIGFEQPGRAPLSLLTAAWPWVVLYGTE